MTSPASEPGLDPSARPEPATMGFFDHLAELRTRLIYSLAAIAICCILALIFWEPLYQFLRIPIVDAFEAVGLDKKLVFISPLEPIRFALQLGVYAGIFLSAPFLFWQVWMFVAPGLYKRERRFAIPFVLSSTVLFLAGTGFAHQIVLPITLEFLLNFGTGHFEAFISIEQYFSLWLTMVLWMGLIFQMPVMIFLLSWIGIATPAFLLHYLRHAVLGITAVAAVVTPTTDAFTLAVFALPMIALYVVGILVSAVVVWSRKRGKRAQQTPGGAA